jgi:integrase
MAVVPRKRKNGIVYFVANRCNGRVQFERVGPDKREATRRDAAMKKEIAAGTYVGKPTGATTVGAFAAEWFANRRNRSVETEEAWWDNHVIGRAKWFTEMKMEDVRPAHVLRLITFLRKPYVSAANQTRGREVMLSEKSIFNIIGVLSTMFRDGRIAGLMTVNACELPRGTLNKRTKKRRPYSAEVVRMLTTDERILPAERMFLTLLFYTGTREGEACGLRWRDWDRKPEPLGSLLVEKQYEGALLKTEKDNLGEATRVVPVHPFLEAALDMWWREGFEHVYCRKPTPDDFVVPCRARHRSGAPYKERFLAHHTRSSAYKLFRRTLAVVGVENQALHATRNTFISLARRAGARADVLERVTHNASGDVIDVYTDFDWAPLCEAVNCFMSAPPNRGASNVADLASESATR